eukprot:gb/GECG01003701.1/.p1 GENE.gb/GECG01003701.1/~~gb/GECG01003701.1/.p1  ORF type:complete len:514 (+),score=57.00 gb/GECG01003701.1/:1-1542(+)
MKSSLTLLAAIVCLCVGSAVASPLWDYVHTDDGHFSWVDTGERLNDQTGWTGYVLNVTSQKWMTINDSSSPIWTHQLLIVVPDNLNKQGSTGKTGMIYMTGGHNGNPGKPDNWGEDALFAASVATRTGTLAGTLFQIPNEPIVFPSDPSHKRRSEDDAVAWTWKMYIENSYYRQHPEFLIEFPMAKAGVKAMDAFTQWAKQNQNMDIEKFAISGASKRGWATWLVGAVDDRVIGIAPIVMDMLNLPRGVAHMWQAYGGWTFAFEPYWVLNITKWVNTPEMVTLADQIDPLQYKENLTMSKLVIDSTGDEFFMPDDDHYWWGDLPGESLRMMVQNAEHSMATGVLELITGVEAWYWGLLTDTPRPQFTWQIENGSGNIHIQANTKPSKVVLRFATTYGSKRRDFRLVKGNTKEDPCDFIPIHIFGDACLNPVFWIGETVAPESVFETRAADGSTVYNYNLSQPLPPAGWRGFFAELYFGGPKGTLYQLTTQVSIIPQTFPFSPCKGMDCIGGLV